MVSASGSGACKKELSLCDETQGHEYRLNYLQLLAWRQSYYTSTYISGRRRGSNVVILKCNQIVMPAFSQNIGECHSDVKY